jgi:Eco57I restriction-modification methylase
MRYVAIRSEGGLLPYDLLDKIVADQVAGQKPAEFGLPKGQRLIDEISRVWADAQNLWSNFKRRRQSLTERDPYGTSITRSWIVSLLSDSEMLGFDLKLQTSAAVVNNVTFAISHRNGNSDDAIPVHIEGCKIDLDRRLHTKLRTSPQAMLQDFLNNSEQASWGILTNGLTLRLLRDSSRTSRPTYLEFDLESILEGNRFTEFALLYRLCHRSRFPSTGQEAADCLLEKYYLDSIEQGLRIRDKLRDGVEKALKILGSAFLQHPANEKLRADYAAGKLTPESFHRQLLLLVYRLLFLMVAEERGLIVAVGEHADRNQKIYDEWYGVTRLRERASRIVEASPFGDVWYGLKQTFSLFEYGLDANALGIPPLNGDLFNEKRAVPDLASAELHNHELLVAVRHLSLFKASNAYQRVNYSGLDVEELGSVYESLLDYKPVVTRGERGLTFDLRTGTERKSTGSYYTRPELVHELVESALVPVMGDRIAAAEKTATGKNLVEERNEKINAILSLTICDPACGSGHFLLAAARRLGKELARVRTGEDEPRPEDFHLAVRDVISHCVYGVDLNPLAVDLCKLALWLEGHWAGKPLSFLDHRIRCGNSLIGVLDPEVLENGVPDDAFNAVTGDDKKIAAFFKRRNKQDRTSRGFVFEPDEHVTQYAASNRQLQDLAENTAAEVRKKAEMYGSWRAGMQHCHDEAVADLWTAQFFLPLTDTTDPAVSTTRDFLEFAVDNRKKPQQTAAAQALAVRNRFFHWHLEFPEVLQNEGFDVVLGNPPWERIKLQEKEHWIDDPYIANAANKAERARRLQEYRSSGEPAKEARVALFDAAKHDSEADGKHCRFSGRFPLTAVGDVNTYALFSELSRQLVAPKGRVGILVPTGIVTDDTTKEFFADVGTKGQLASIVGFENEDFIFPAVHHAFKFCALTMTGAAAKIQRADLVFWCRRFSDVMDPRRHFQLSGNDLRVISPNTQTCPTFRTASDASLTLKLYEGCPVLWKQRNSAVNPWSIQSLRAFHMANDSGLFADSARTDYLPLYEAKMMHQFDHRWGTYDGATPENRNAGILPQLTDASKADPNLSVMPRYWVPNAEVQKRYEDWNHKWLFGFRDITAAMVERTGIFSILPFVGVGHSISLMAPQLQDTELPLVCCLLANLNSLATDFVIRTKLTYIHLSYFVLKQIPVLPPQRYAAEDVLFIVPRVLELVYSANDLAGFATEIYDKADNDLRCKIADQYLLNGTVIRQGDRLPPFRWDPVRRAQIRAEIDAYYAHLYHLTRDEIRYVLDPREVFGADFPSETFRVLMEREQKNIGEYRTGRLVLAAFDELSKNGRFAAEIPARKSAIQAPESKILVAVQ